MEESAVQSSPETLPLPGFGEFAMSGMCSIMYEPCSLSFLRGEIGGGGCGGCGGCDDYSTR